ncbi:MAG: hypothetical protein SOW78_09395 [Clostridia bacterium]|nr:hypothetical protein [Clostridia bacterium]
MQSDRIYAQLRFLNGGKNQYVYETSDTVGQNDYLNCSSVVFYIDEAVSQSMQCEPYMLLENSLYDYVSPIGTQRRLGSREIAVSSNVAKLYGLSVGSVVYSIHKLHNAVVKYSIAEILPVNYGILQTDISINRGAILMGFDSEYIENFSYTYIGFSEKDPSDLIIEANVGLISLQSTKEIKNALYGKVIVWQCVIGLLTTAGTVVYVAIHWNKQKQYYNRLVIDGMQIKCVKKQIFVDMLLPGVIGAILSLAFNVLLASLYNGYFSFVTAAISIGITLLVLFGLAVVYSRKGRNT